MKKSAYIILNPVANRGKSLRHVAEIEAEMDKYGLHYELVLSRGSGHAMELAKNAALNSADSMSPSSPLYGVIVAAGGDGTVNEVLNGLMEAREQLREEKREEQMPDFGVLPVGRGNDFAYGAGIPHELRSACHMLAQDRAYRMDVGKVLGGYYPQGRYFANGIGIGFDTLVGLEAAKTTWLSGFIGYVYGALKMFLIFPEAPHLRISWGDGKNGQERDLETRSHQISIMNGRRMGGTFFMAPDASNHDGSLDLCMTRQSLSRKEMFRAIGQYTRGTQGKNPLILTDRASSFTIHSPEGGLACHADGETICIDGTELKVQCVAAALRIRSTPKEG